MDEQEMQQQALFLVYLADAMGLRQDDGSFDANDVLQQYQGLDDSGRQQLNDGFQDWVGTQQQDPIDNLDTSLEYAMQVMQQLDQQQSQAAGSAQYERQGGKLDYISRLNGSCPEGYELSYYKKGGKLCRKCTKKHQEGGKASKAADPLEQFKAEHAARRGKAVKGQKGVEIVASPLMERIYDPATLKKVLIAQKALNGKPNRITTSRDSVNIYDFRPDLAKMGYQFDYPVDWDGNVIVGDAGPIIAIDSPEYAKRAKVFQDYLKGLF